MKIKKAQDDLRKVKRTLSSVCSFSESTISCTSPLWTQYMKHKPIFNLIRRKIRLYTSYYSTYKEALAKFYVAARESASNQNSRELQKCYGDLWDSICDFFTGKEYLGTYNPAFFNTKRKKERDEILDKVFEVNEVNIECELYESILHLLYKEMVEDRYENLRKLQKILFITKRWRELLCYKKTE